MSNMFYCSFVSIHYIICECGDTFPTEEALKEHLELDHNHKLERNEYKCDTCDKVFATEKACLIHQYVHTAPHVKNKDEEKKDKEPIRLDPIKPQKSVVTNMIQVLRDSKETKVEIRSKGIKAPRAQKEPREPKEPSEPKEPRELKEPKEPKEPREPRKSREPKNPNEEESKREKKKLYNLKNIVCEVCGKRYASNAALRYHQRVHTGERPYQCSLCPKNFTMPLFLQIHMRTHTGERPYECLHCPKAFSNKAALLRHDRVHTGIKPYACPKCGKTFTQSNSMKLHVKTVHLKMPAPYKSKSRRLKQAAKEMKVHLEIQDAVYKPEVKTEQMETFTTEVYQEEITDDQIYQEVKSEAPVYEEIYTEDFDDDHINQDGELKYAEYEEVEVEHPEIQLYEGTEDDEPQVLYVYEEEANEESVEESTN